MGSNKFCCVSKICVPPIPNVNTYRYDWNPEIGIGIESSWYWYWYDISKVWYLVSVYFLVLVEYWGQILLSGTGMDFAYLCPKEYFWSEQNSGLKKFGPRTFWPTKIMTFRKLSLNKLGLSWAKLCSNWNWILPHTTPYNHPWTENQHTGSACNNATKLKVPRL